MLDRSPDRDPHRPRAEVFRPRKVRARRWRRVVGFVALVGLAVALSTFVWLTRPSELEARMRTELDRRLALSYSVGEVRYEFPGRLIVENLEVMSPEGARYPRVLEIPRTTFEFSWIKWWYDGQPLGRVHLENPRLFLELGTDSTVPLSQLLAPTDETEEVEGALPEIRIDRLELHTCPKTIFRQDVPLLVQDFSLELQSDDQYRVSSSAAHSFFRRVQLAGDGARKESRFSGKIVVDRLDLDAEIRDRLPPRFLSLYDTYSPEGVATAHLQFEVIGGRLADWSLDLEILEARVALADFDLSLEAVHGTLRLEPQASLTATEALNPNLAPSDADSVLLPGEIRTITPLVGVVRGAQAQVTGRLSLADLEITEQELEIEIDQLPLDAQTVSYFQGELRSILELLEPRGKAGVNLSLSGGKSPVVHLEKMRLHDVQLLGPRLPLPLDRLNGELRRIDDDFHVELEGTVAGTPARLRGLVDAAELDQFDVRLEISQIDLEKDLEPILPDRAQRVWREYSPQGKADLAVEVTKGRDDDRVLLVATLNPREAEFNYWRFPYPLTNVTGTLRLRGDLDPDDDYHFVPSAIDFRELEGRHEQTSVRVDAGEFLFANAERGAMLEMPIVSPNLRLTPSLIAAFPERSRKLMRSIDLKGTVSAEVRIFSPTPGAKLDLSVEAQVLSPVVLRYAPLAYPLHLKAGTASYRLSSRSIFLRDFETIGDRRPVVRIDGTHVPGESSGTQDLQLFIRIAAGQSTPGLKLDNPEFVDPLPDRFSKLFRRLEVTGFLTGELRISYRYRQSPEDRRPVDQQIEYQGELTLIEGTARMGVRIRDAFARMLIHGQGGVDQVPKHRFTALIPKGQLRLSRFLLQDAKVQVTFGEPHAQLKEDESDYEVPAPFRLRLAERQTHQALQIYLKKGTVYGGQARGFFFIDTGKRRDYLGHFKASGVDLAEASPDIVRRGHSIAGTMRGEVRFGGSTDRKKAISGRGYLFVRDGKIRKLPLALSILTNPVAGWLSDWDDSQRTIEEIDARFDLRGTKVLLPSYDDLTLRTPNHEIRGKGWIDFDKSIDLLFEPQGSLYGVIGLGDLFDGLVRQRLTGTLLKPIRSSAPLR